MTDIEHISNTGNREHVAPYGSESDRIHEKREQRTERDNPC